LTQREELLGLYELFPFQEHPLWRQVKAGVLSMDEVLRAEVQHCLRTQAGQALRGEALAMARNTSQQCEARDLVRAASEKIFGMLLETYIEECTNSAAGPNHLELIRRLVLTGGISEQQIESTEPTPGNAAAMAMYREITRRGAGCHMLGAGAVEHFYCILAPEIFQAYTEHYGMSAEQAETYSKHGPMDHTHAERAFAVLDDAVALHGWDAVRLSVRDAFVATSLHYDGMLQAATGQLDFWNGRS
jgi:pyrroloquinoline quinone (PQQ) biosynthesis protein C